MPFVHQLLIAAALTVVATQSSSATLQDEDLNRALQGVWCNSDDGGKTCHGYDEYVDGTSSFCGAFPESKEPYTAAMRYKIQGNRICAVITASSNPIIGPGFSFCDEILEIDEHSVRSYTAWFDTVETRFRVPKSQMTCAPPEKPPLPR
ncbi:hypothetical protein ABIC89_006183 [Variovorax boronicumulans]|uniref:hypothetical protein n=1 Tax=Variovorax boronicumulans TaxID=436515 RepID=UPI003391D17A